MLVSQKQKLANCRMCAMNFPQYFRLLLISSHERSDAKERLEKLIRELGSETES